VGSSGDAERAAYEQSARDDGLTDFQFRRWTPEGDSPWTASESEWANEYVPAYLLEPYEANKSAIGIDVASNPTRREALRRARDSGRAVATARITLAQDAVEQAGFLIFVPVYAVGTSTETINDRRANLTGFAVGVFRVDDIVNQVLADLEFDEVRLSITDQSATEDQQLLFDNSLKLENRNLKTSQYDTGKNPASMSEYEVGGRRWQFEFSATSQYLLSRSRWDSWLILAVGSLSALLLGVVLHLVIGRTGEVEVLVLLRTEQLREANTQLEQEGLERELAQLELQAKAVELQKSNEHLLRFNSSAAGRELRMIELKREINELLAASGQPARYDVSFGEK
jgi:CHASE1-domain containing sensor protein